MNKRLKERQDKVEREAVMEALANGQEFAEVSQSTKKKAISKRRKSLHFRRAEAAAHKKLGEQLALVPFEICSVSSFHPAR